MLGSKSSSSMMSCCNVPSYIALALISEAGGIPTPVAAWIIGPARGAGIDPNQAEAEKEASRI